MNRVKVREQNNQNGTQYEHEWISFRSPSFSLSLNVSYTNNKAKKKVYRVGFFFKNSAWKCTRLSATLILGLVFFESQIHLIIVKFLNFFFIYY